MRPADYIQGAIALMLKLDNEGNIVAGKAVRSTSQMLHMAPDVIIWSRPPSPDEERLAESRLKTTLGIQFVADPHPLSRGVRLIHEERQTHAARGFTDSHDDTHTRGELATAARCYAWHAVVGIVTGALDAVPISWPWPRAQFRAATPLRMLVKAGALIAAEIERLLRRSPELAQEARK